MYIGNAYFGNWKDLTVMLLIFLAELAFVGFFVWVFSTKFW